MDDLSLIRKRIRERRETLGYSYQNLADLTHMSKSTLQRYETGQIGNLPLDKLETLAQALQCSPSYLMGWVEDPQGRGVAFAIEADSPEEAITQATRARFNDPGMSREKAAQMFEASGVDLLRIEGPDDLADILAKVAQAYIKADEGTQAAVCKLLDVELEEQQDK